MKKKLLIFSTSQFGYLIDSYKYAQYSRPYFDITYLCWDYSRPKLTLDNVNVRYVSRQGNLIARNLRLLYALYKEINRDSYLVFANYTPGISIIKLLCFKRRILIDVRTLSVNPRKLVRLFSDIILKCELLFFNHISVVSREVASKLILKDYYLIPLGGESFCDQEKSFERLHLLYVGTLQGRRILDCVKGFHNYLKRLEHSVKAKTFLTIIGDSPDGEQEEIKQYVNANGLEINVKTEGYVRNENLGSFFEKANVGVSYIPLTNYFDGQPPTKTYEYLLSGLPVIATRTKANQKIVNDYSGVLVDDDVDSFQQGIVALAANSLRFQSDKIRSHYSDSLWKSIVDEIFSPKVSSLGRK